MKRLLSIALLTALVASGCSAPLTSTESTTPANTEKKQIALRFDDGPNESVMPMILDILEQYNVPATFFLIGNFINESNAHVVKRAYDMGCEIANHSYSHTHMREMSESEILKEVNTVQDQVEAIIGERPKYFAAPFGEYSDTMLEKIDLVLIGSKSKGCADYKMDVSVQQRIDSVLEIADDGVVFVLHCHRDDGSMYNIPALKVIIPTLLEQGYEFVTISQMFERQGVTPEANNGIRYGKETPIKKDD